MRKALGRGLAALIPTEEISKNTSSTGTQQDVSLKIPIEKICVNRYQPRKHFDQEKLSELASSIKEHGLAQPIVVSYDQAKDNYEIIAGERRLRACELAGMNEVEVIIRSAKSDKQRLALALVENLQREDLNAIEQALGYLRLMKEFQISQTELTQVVGKSKSSVSNTLRLLELPENIQKSIQCRQISEGHARAILMVPDHSLRQVLFNRVLEQNLSVRDTEDLARTTNKKDDISDSYKTNKPSKSADIKSIETSLQHRLGTKVDIKTKKDPTKGSVTIFFYSLTDFDKIVKVLTK